MYMDVYDGLNQWMKKKQTEQILNMPFFIHETVATDVISTYIALPNCKKEKSFFFPHIVYDGIITFLYHFYVIMKHLQFPNISQISA